MIHCRDEDAPTSLELIPLNFARTSLIIVVTLLLHHSLCRPRTCTTHIHKTVYEGIEREIYGPVLLFSSSIDSAGNLTVLCSTAWPFNFPSQQLICTAAWPRERGVCFDEIIAPKTFYGARNLCSNYFHRHSQKANIIRRPNKMPQHRRQPAKAPNQPGGGAFVE